jgi:glutamine amidotransferase
MRGLSPDAHAYFVHSYYVGADAARNGAVSSYGPDFMSVVSRDNVHATQFHPEKSQRVGLKILENFRAFVEES